MGIGWNQMVGERTAKVRRMWRVSDRRRPGTTLAITEGMTKATHSGHCQACGSLQKLPKSVLSLHGYKVHSGYFSGVCPGARSLPFEVSCDLVKGFIANAKAQLAAVTKQQADLRKTAMNTMAWVHHYVGNSQGARSSYQWVRVVLRVETDAEGRHKYFYTARKAGGRWTVDTQGYQGWEQAEKQLTDYDYGTRPVAEFVTKLNATYADWLQHEVDSLRRYIAWQKDRVTNWKPTPLLPVDAKADKTVEFTPTEAKY